MHMSTEHDSEGEAIEAALRLTQESLLWELQRMQDGLWLTVETQIPGRSAALAMLNSSKADGGGRWRVLPINEADKYREGVAAAKRAATKPKPDLKRPRGPKRYVPPGGW